MILMPADATPSYPCPCCGYLVFPEPAGSFDVCPICFWEDDLVQLVFPDLSGGANKCSLIEGQLNYERIGVCEARLAPYVRHPMPEQKRATGWRRIDPTRDRYLRWEHAGDHDVWERVKNDPDRCDYYWLPNCRLLQRPAE
jgi:hypothetical protein